MNGWIKLHRSLLDWQWWDDFNTSRLWIWLLLNANREQAKWRGLMIMPGQCVTSLDKMCTGTGLTLGEVRSALDHLKKTGSITSRATNKFTLITVANWELFQLEDRKTARGAAGLWQTDDNPPTTNKNNKKLRNKTGDSPLFPPLKKAYGEFKNVMLTDDELIKLKGRFSDYINRIERLSAYLASKKTSYTSHFAVICTWARNDAGKPEGGLDAKKRLLDEMISREEGGYGGEIRDREAFADHARVLPERQN